MVLEEAGGNATSGTHPYDGRANGNLDFLQLLPW